MKSYNKTKVAVVTIQSINYGNRLQNYALQKILTNFDIKVESIKYKESDYKIRLLKSLCKAILRKGKGWREIKRICLFYLWDKENIIFSKIKATYNGYEFANENGYDFFLAGSDQIWHPNMAKFTLLKFAEPQKRISYSASFGVDQINESQKSIYGNELRLFHSISVRENSSKEIVRELTGKEPVVTLDPTFLLGVNEWSAMERKPYGITDGKYILIYTLGGLNSELNNRISSLSSKYNLKIYDVLNDFYATDPFEFIYMVNHASLCVTDSFHGTVFSMIFSTPFIVFRREGRLNSIFSRLESLLTEFDCMCRIYNSDMSDSELFKKINIQNLDYKRKLSVDYLLESLGVN